jgi:hypothetical protein
MPSESNIITPFVSGVGKRFRGTIAENAARFKLVGGAYASMPREQNGYFSLKSARHLEGPLRALADPNVREVILIGAVQVLKSIAGDIWTAYCIEHIRRNMLILFETDQKAKFFGDTRLMETIKNHPVIAEWIQSVNRDDVTKMEIKIGGVTIKIGGMNDSNCSSLSWPLIWISEAYQHKSDGMLGKAIRRADRYPDDHKIFIESRAGMAGEDLHERAKLAHPVHCVWACPYCGGRQVWDFSQRRDDGSFAGMKFDEGKTIAERVEHARWNCLKCGEDIEDRPVIRQQIADSYVQDYKINGVSPRRVVFYLPKESAVGNSFRNSSENYLVAKEAKAMGNDVKIADWFMEERAIFYEPSLSQPMIVSVSSGYDPHQTIENEHHKGMVIDCQKHLELDTVGTFWFEVYAADKAGNSFQLDRGFVTSWAKLDEIQKRWNISNKNVAIDGRKWTPEILKQVASRRVSVNGIWFGREVLMPSTWTVLMGDAPARHYPWPDKQYRVWSPATRRQEIIVNEKQVSESVPVYMIRWSHISIGDQLNQLRIGGEGQPKFESLAFKQLSPETQTVEKGDLAYDVQMSAEIRVEKNGKASWEKIRKNNHYLDLARMRLVQMARHGLASHVVAPPEN